MEIINSQNAPAAIGPYSQAIVVNGCVYTSGQIALDPRTGDINGLDITQQTEQVMKNLDAVLTEAKSGLNNIIKTTCFLVEMGDFTKFNAVYEKWIQHKPARSCVAVKTLPKNVLVEVEVIAVVRE